jgi:hypothetical protein
MKDLIDVGVKWKLADRRNAAVMYVMEWEME